MKFIVIQITFLLASQLYAQGSISQAETHSRHLEIDLKIGSLFYLNNLDPKPKITSLLGGQIGYNFSESSMVGIHIFIGPGQQLHLGDYSYASGTYGNFLLTYRHQLTLQKEILLYFEGGE